MAFFQNKTGEAEHVKVSEDIYKAAHQENVTVAQHINALYAKDCDLKIGTPFQQLCASEGLVRQDKNLFGLRSPMIADILDGKSGFGAGPANTEQKGTPFGTASRVLFPAAIIQLIEDAIQPDRVTDQVMFQDMIATTIGIDNNTFLQPVLSYANVGGANNTAGTAARAQRIAQLAATPTMLQLTTSDRARTIPTYGVGIEMSEQALRATTLDLLALTVGRFLAIEKDNRVYTYLSNLFAGDSDQNTGAVSSVATITLDPTCATGTVTHKAWVSFLARSRKKRTITHCISDVATYLLVEGRTGRPGTTAYDPTISRIDPQAIAKNVSFGSDVKWFLVDDASATPAGPVPANTVWALDAKQAAMLVTNTSAAYQATEAFVLRRSEALVIHWAEEVYRLYGDTDLTPFDVLTVS